MGESIPSKALKKQRRRAASRGVTMAAVGRIAGVTQVTVSRALSDPAKVSPKTLAKIQDAIEMTGFVPNALAGALASSRSKLVTALVPSITNIVYASMIRSFSERMRDSGYQILLSETGFDPEDEQRLIAAHLSRRPDAVLLTGVHHTAQSRKMLLSSGIPVVEVWDITTSPIDMCVGFDHEEAGRAAADFAIEHGYNRAGTVSAGDERALRRKDAFTHRFRSRAGGAATPEVNFRGPASLANGRLGLSRLIEEHGFRKGVIFCSSDLLAHGIIIEAKARGLDIPQDIAVMGFGDQDFAKDTEPAITTVRVDREALGLFAARAMLDSFGGEEPDQPVFDVGYEIVQRASA